MPHSPRPQKTKGFAEILVLIGFGVAALASLWYAANVEHDAATARFGATVYTTQLTDTINTFRNEVNSSTANLNTELEMVSSTVISLSSTLTTVPISNGGTGTTTIPTNGQILIGSSSAYALKTLQGGSGITISSTATSVILNTLGFDNTANINFTGADTFASSTTFNATATFTSSTVLNGLTTVNATATVTATLIVSSTLDLTRATVSSSLIYTTSTNFSPPSGSLGCNAATQWGTTSTILSDGTQRAVISAGGGFMFSAGGGQTSNVNFSVYVDGSSVASNGYAIQAGGAGDGAGFNVSTITTLLGAGSHTINESVSDTGSTGCAGIGTMAITGDAFLIRTR